MGDKISRAFTMSIIMCNTHIFRTGKGRQLLIHIKNHQDVNLYALYTPVSWRLHQEEGTACPRGNLVQSLPSLDVPSVSAPLAP